METVWVVESGEYEQSGVVLVAPSRAEAVIGVKAMYGPPYIVRWDEVTDDVLVGHFEAVSHYSTSHDANYYLMEMALTGAPEMMSAEEQSSLLRVVRAALWLDDEFAAGRGGLSGSLRAHSELRNARAALSPELLTRIEASEPCPG